jgi:hypothetical protein
MSWASNGDLLAYNDIGPLGIHQVFVTSPDGFEQVQISQFIEEYTLVENIQWSPDNKLLAFTHNWMDLEGPSDELVVASLDGEIFRYTFEEQFHFIHTIYWEGNNKLIIYGEDRDYQDTVVLFDIMSGEQEILFSWETLGIEFSFNSVVRMSSTGSLAFYGAAIGEFGRMHTYDLSTGEIISYDSTDFIFQRIIYGPPEGYQGEEYCLSQ